MAVNNSYVTLLNCLPKIEAAVSADVEILKEGGNTTDTLLVGS